MEAQLTANVKKERHQVEEKGAEDWQVDGVPVDGGLPFDRQVVDHLGVVGALVVDVHFVLAAGVHRRPLGVLHKTVQVDVFR